MTPRGALVYFTDENTLGMGKLLRNSGRGDILYPGHEDLPDIPLGTSDLTWLPIVGVREFVVITRDKRIRTRPAELDLYHEHGVRSVWLGAKKDLRPQDQVNLFMRHEARLEREIIKRGRGPWALTMNVNGIKPLTLRPRPGDASSEPT